MNVICTDGTSFRCDRYELTEKGVKLYSGDAEEAPDRYESDTDEHQIGFIPDAMLLYILPEWVRPVSVSPAQPPQQPRRRPTQQSTGQPSVGATQPGAGQQPYR